MTTNNDPCHDPKCHPEPVTSYCHYCNDSYWNFTQTDDWGYQKCQKEDWEISIKVIGTTAAQELV